MRESREAKRARARRIVRGLKKAYPDARIALDFGNPLELLVATILSAQCTDERVNMVTPTLFKKYPSARDYARADAASLEQDVRSTGFYRAKSRSIIGMARALVDKHEGEVPRSRELLTELPGVGLKTANVILVNAFGGRHARVPGVPATGSGPLGGSRRDPRPARRRAAGARADADDAFLAGPRTPVLCRQETAVSGLPRSDALPVARQDQDSLTGLLFSFKVMPRANFSVGTPT